MAADEITYATVRCGICGQCTGCECESMPVLHKQARRKRKAAAVRHTSHHTSRRSSPKVSLRWCIEAQGRIAQAERERSASVLEAYEAGWTMREIAEAVGLSQATVYRIIRAERSAAA